MLLEPVAAAEVNVPPFSNSDGMAAPPRDNFWGKLIRNLRDEKGISQRQLASGARVNRSTLRRIEEGEADGDIKIMERLLSYLDYELEAMARESLSERLKLDKKAEVDPDYRSRLAVSRLLTMACPPRKMR